MEAGRQREMLSAWIVQLEKLSDRIVFRGGTRLIQGSRGCGTVRNYGNNTTNPMREFKKIQETIRELALRPNNVMKQQGYTVTSRCDSRQVISGRRSAIHDLLSQSWGLANQALLRERISPSNDRFGYIR